MQFSGLLSLAAMLPFAAAQYKGFNTGSTKTDGSAKSQADFEAEFAAGAALPGASGFTSARLYTCIQAGTTADPIQAIPAAIAQDTSLLLGLWASGGQADLTNEIAALTAAITQYGTAFTDRVVAISVGSEDLYRTSTIGIAAQAGVGTTPDVLLSYINQVKSALASTTLKSAKITHVDTYNAWTNGSNAAVIEAVDFLSMDVYPYYQSEMANSIDQASALFNTAYAETVAVSQGKEVWVSETGWPVSGPNQGAGVASIENAQTYWDQVGCNTLFGKVNTYWYILQDAVPTLPSPSFGIVGAGPVSQAPLFNLTCPAAAVASSASASSGVAAASSAPVRSATTSATPRPINVAGIAGVDASSSSTHAQSSRAASTGRPGFNVATERPSSASVARSVSTVHMSSSSTKVTTTTTGAAHASQTTTKADASLQAQVPSVTSATSGGVPLVVPVIANLLAIVALLMNL